MKQRIFFSLICACLVTILSVYPSTVVLADKPVRWDTDWVIDNPVWATCPDGAAISEYTTFHIDVVEFLDKNGNRMRMVEQFRLVEGGITLVGTDSFLPWKVEADNQTYYGDPITLAVGIYNAGLLTLPGYGRVTQMTGRWVFTPNPEDPEGPWILIFQSGKFEINLDAICAYFGH